MSPYLTTIKALNQAQVRYVVVGGFAAVMHGTNRFTADIDIALDLESQNVKRAVETIMNLGWQARIPVDPYQFADPDKRKSWAEEKGLRVFSFFDPNNRTFAVDFFVQDPLPFNDLFKNSVLLSIQGQEARICSVDDLIAMKQIANRPQDQLDIQALNIIKERIKK
jgi:hypothetical protein